MKAFRKYVKNLVIQAQAGNLEAIRTLGALVFVFNRV
jgi:hypothetical protein